MANLRKNGSGLIRVPGVSLAKCSDAVTTFTYYYLQPCGSIVCSDAFGVLVDDVTDASVVILWLGICWTLCNPSDLVPDFIAHPDDFTELESCLDASCVDDGCYCPCREDVGACDTPTSWYILPIDEQLGCCTRNPLGSRAFRASGNPAPACVTSAGGWTAACTGVEMKEYIDNTMDGQAFCDEEEDQTRTFIYEVGATELIIRSTPGISHYIFYSSSFNRDFCGLQYVVNELTECNYSGTVRSIGHSGACYAVPCCGG
jgi:hypothetical protein